MVGKLVVKKSTKQLHFGPVLPTNDSSSTREASVMSLLLSIRKFFAARLNNKCANFSKQPHSGVNFVIVRHLIPASSRYKCLSRR